MKKLVSPQGVVWPSRKSCWHKTGIVICTCIAFGAVLIAADSLFGLVFQFLIG
ncbi:preprotein translocase subunit SecE [Candidatus Allofournierella merdipullorum]|uniref:preprotein translocase subunit SecE n=1 Tax=Candidatus Allofournierella merdipullorum TaxID=2838595 RepID=UPI00374FCEFF